MMPECLMLVCTTNETVFLYGRVKAAGGGVLAPVPCHLPFTNRACAMQGSCQWRLQPAPRPHPPLRL